MHARHQELHWSSISHIGNGLHVCVHSIPASVHGVLCSVPNLFGCEDGPESKLAARLAVIHLLLVIVRKQGLSGCSTSPALGHQLLAGLAWRLRRSHV